MNLNVAPRVKSRFRFSPFSPTIRFCFTPHSRLTRGVIDTRHKLAEFLPKLAAAAWVAVDTEADSLHAYPQKLCLLQISLPGADELIDPLASVDLTSLLERMREHELILHGADYDLRLLYRAFHFVPDAVFDTMLAARLLGHREVGLTNLVSTLLGVRLEKGPQKADWARRPLTERMEQYARNDARFLKPLADLLRLDLDQKQRSAWHRETCARLIQDCARLTPPDHDQVWRVKGADRLDRRGLAVLRELWRWREGEAVAADRPPYFVLSHETLVALANAAADSQSIEHLLPSGLSRNRRHRLLSALQEALVLPPERWPRRNRPSGRRPSPEERERYEQLRQKRDRVASALGIDPTLIASRATLSSLAMAGDAHQQELMAWQRQLLRA